MKSSTNQKQIDDSRDQQAHLKISASVCAVQDTLSKCTKQNKEELKDFSKCLKDVYNEAGKTNPDIENMKMLFEGIKKGYELTKSLIGQGGPSVTVLNVLKDNTHTLYGLMETHTTKM